MQFALSIGIPVILIVAGMFFNWSAANSLCAAIDTLRSDHDKKFDAVNGRFDVLKDYINMRFQEVNGRFGEINGRFDEIKEAVHKDALVVLKEMAELHVRIAVVESKQK